MDGRDYNLLIEVKCLSKYSELLKIGEIPRDSQNQIVITVRNTGSQTFNGSLKQFNIKYTHPVSNPTIINLDKTIYNLKNNGEQEIYKDSIPMLIEGNGYFECKLKSTNNESDTIEYFTNNGRRSLGKKLWFYPFTVVNREKLEIILLLQDIQKKVNEL
jgi:archaellum component FlaG (FlaF/FlaG flagellin family)